MNKAIFEGILIHPGYSIKEALNDRNISREELSLRIGYSINYISSVIDGKKDISVKFANRLEYALGIPAHFWINLQNIYDRELL